MDAAMTDQGARPGTAPQKSARSAANLLPIWTTEIGVTDQRLIFKRGLLWRTTQELQLRAIEEVNLDQGLFGRLTTTDGLHCAGQA